MSDDDSDDKQAEVDAEIARKCSLVMQPLIKKFKRHSKKLAALEEEIEKQRQATDTGFPAQGAELAAMRSELEQAVERLHRDIGERVRHEDHARVEVGMGSQLAKMESTVEDLRTRLATQEIYNKTLEHRLGEVEASSRRGNEAVEERIAALRTTVADEASRSDSRRAELQLHISEVSAKLHTELVEVRAAPRFIPPCLLSLLTLLHACIFTGPPRARRRAAQAPVAGQHHGQALRGARALRRPGGGVGRLDRPRR